MLGDVLKNNLYLLKNASTNKDAKNALWIILRDIAREEIIAYGKGVDSDQLIPLYYEILKDNEEYIPFYYIEKLPSNNQERYRVALRNAISSNAFHPDGLANMDGIKAKKMPNRSRKGDRIFYIKEY